jgi:hypothetical protein
MQNLPLYISIVFMLSTAFAVYIFWNAAGRSKIVLSIIAVWLMVQGIISYSGFYLHTTGLPPRFALTLVPALIAIIILFTSRKGRRFIDRLNLAQLSLLHIVRIPVELVLLWLFMHKAVPQVITFEGHNFDIFSGITAPMAWYMARKNMNSKFLLAWNLICLGLLINVVVTAILAAPFDFQQIAFDQPTIAVLYFPFAWLPACVVPLVLLSHLVAIRQLAMKNKERFAMAQ